MRNVIPSMAMLAFVTLGCAGSPPADSQPGSQPSPGGKGDDARRTGGGFVQANSPFYWADSDYQSFTATLSVPLGTLVDDDSPIAQRVQYWVDRIHEVVSDQVVQASGTPLLAPRPRIKVAQMKGINAWATPVLACTGLRFPNAAPPGDPDGGTEAAIVDHLSPYGYIQVTNAACVRPEWPGATDFVAFWDRPVPACRLASDLTPGPDCVTYGSAGEIAITSTSPWIHMTVDLVASLEEPDVVLSLAHELGHYYRSHASQAQVDKYDFWYDTGPKHEKVPLSQVEAEQLRAEYQQIAKAPQALVATVPGHFSPRLRTFIIAGLVPLLVERTEPDFVCASARDALGPWVPVLLFGTGSVPSDALDGYFAFEQRLVACGADLRLDFEESATTLGIDHVETAIMNFLPYYLWSGLILHKDDSLALFLKTLDSMALDIDTKAAQLAQKLHENHIGLYTNEQEADELSLAISTRLGLSPEQALAAWLGAMKVVEATLPDAFRAMYLKNEGYSAAECEDLLSHGFATKDAQGHEVPVFVPMGDLGDPHHANCYRLFNLWRTQEEKQYVASGSFAPPAPDWSAIRALARQLADTAVPPGGP